jgi:DNA polymerase family B
VTNNFKKPPCFAFDTETIDGEPLTIQFAGEAITELELVDRQTILPAFLRYLWTYGSEKDTSILFAHNLEFDLGMVFVNHVERLWSTVHLNLSLPMGNGHHVHLQLSSAGNTHARLNLGGKRWLLLDTMSFFRLSLEEATERLQLPVRKLARPPYLGTRPPTSSEWPAFREYAIADALATLELGRFILRCHDEFEVAPTVSVAHMASTIFRTHFLQGNGPPPVTHRELPLDADPVSIPFCEISPGDNALLEASLESYHGGKSRLYVPPGVYDDVKAVDIVSAYPHAMAALPPLTAGRWVSVRDYHPDAAAVYHIRGRVRRRCPFGLFPTPKRRAEARTEYVEQGSFDVWVTGWELAAAWNEIDLDSVEGFIWVPAPGAVNPFRSYVEKFFQLKRDTLKDDPRRELYKLLLNSLYGKTIQRHPLGLDWVAGGIFNGFWAAQITGHCRARLHRLEHDCDALHSSTDSVLTRTSHIPTGAELGQLQVVAHGRLVVARSKLYVILDDDGRIMKDGDAFQAFLGSPEQFLTILRTGTPTYTVKRMVRPRESLRTGQKPFRMVERSNTLHLSPEVLQTLRQQLART